MILIDRRNSKSEKNTSNRERFIRRHKRYFKRKLDAQTNDLNIKDVDGSVNVNCGRGLAEIRIGFDSSVGQNDFVLSGNSSFKKGDWIHNKKASESNGGTGIGAEGEEDSFLLTLSKEEFFDVYFSDMALPNLVKESSIDITRKDLRRAGYSKDGPWNRLDLLKTFSFALSRKIANKKSEIKQPFLDDYDLRYRHFVLQPKPMLKAVMICLMDVSGSMTEFHKYLAKKFFMLLYLFLVKNYQSVELRFVRYHSYPSDCSEEDFFYKKETGGTDLMPALEMVNDIIEKDYSSDVYNVYLAHVSDGDLGYEDDEDLIISYIDNILIPKLQYYAYVQIMDLYQSKMFDRAEEKLFGILGKSSQLHKKLNRAAVNSSDEIFIALKNLFSKGDC